MAQKYRYYRVQQVGAYLRKSLPLKEVKGGTIVQAIESAPQGSLDVIDVKTLGGRVKSVYSFQLTRPIRKPKNR